MSMYTGCLPNKSKKKKKIVEATSIRKGKKISKKCEEKQRTNEAHVQVHMSIFVH